MSVEEEEEDSEDITESARISYKSTPTPITWKAGQDLTKTKAGQPPSFFTFFSWVNSDDEGKKDVFENAHEVAILIAEELYPNAVKLFSKFVYCVFKKVKLTCSYSGCFK